MDRALTLLHGNDDACAAILRARCLLRVGRTADAADELRDVSLQGASALVRTEVNVLAANAAARLQDPDRELAFGDAEAALADGDTANLHAEFSFIRARTAWAHGQLDVAEAFATSVLEHEADDGSAVPHLYHTRALALELLGLIASDRGRFDLAAARFRDALGELDNAPFSDEWITAFVTANIAVLARDFPWAADARFLVERIDRVRWLPPLTSRHFLCLHGLGWCRAHEGDHVGALRAFHDAADVAPSVPLRIVAWVDHAMLGRQLGAELVAEECARYAVDLAATVSWETIRDGDRFALLFLAEALAPVDVSLAREVLNRYEDTRELIDTVLTGDTNRTNARPRALEQRAEGAVARAEGLIPRARALFRCEFETWRRIGSEPRAAIAALDAYELDHDPVLLDFARRAAASTPSSWILRRVAESR